MTGKSLIKYGILLRLFQVELYNRLLKIKAMRKLREIKKGETLREVYLFIPEICVNKYSKMSKRRKLAKSIRVLENTKGQKQLFLDAKTALLHSRYLSHNPAIIKAYVTEKAITADENDLYLRSGYIHSENIHSLYLSLGESDKTLLNPKFMHDYSSAPQR